jgi:hypothetical protein
MIKLVIIFAHLRRKDKLNVASNFLALTGAL